MKHIKLSEIANINFCTITPSRSKPSATPTKWLVCANFLVDNEIDKNTSVNNVLPDENWLLHKNDIIVKRIAPTFVNYIDSIDNGIYCGNNLIIITPNDKVDSKYLAMILNEQIGSLSKESSIGAVMKSISRTDLEEMSIPFPDIKTQKAIGSLWHNGIELKKKRIRLAELENIKTNFTINKAIKMLGGKKNG